MNKVTIVTVTFNCKDTLEETIQSVIAQDYSDIDYVIVDGASNDGTLEIINKYRERIQTVVSEKDSGIFDAMNKSLRYVKGEYVLFMNAGDKFVADNVVSRVFAFCEHKEDLIYGDTYIQTEFGYKFCKAKSLYESIPSKRDLVFRSQGFCHQSLFTRTDRLRNVMFNLEYIIGADYDTTARVFFTGNHSISYCGFPVSVFDDRMGGVSHYKAVKMYRERFKMFDYQPTLFDWLRVYCSKWVTDVKHRLERVFPSLVKEYRSKKYEKSL